jgi:hypothetical protein
MKDEFERIWMEAAIVWPNNIPWNLLGPIKSAINLRTAIVPAEIQTSPKYGFTSRPLAVRQPVRQDSRYGTGGHSINTTDMCLGGAERHGEGAELDTMGELFVVCLSTSKLNTRKQFKILHSLR